MMKPVWRAWFGVLILCAAGLAISAPSRLRASSGLQAGAASNTPQPAGEEGVFSPEKLASLLPATVYFQGRSAAVQLRNAAGVSFGQNAIVWAALVDTSGYSTSVQERYQFYFVTETGLRFGDVHLAPGAYGAGYVGDHFLVMDLGGHEVGSGATTEDAALRRPRPLQMVADGPGSVKLYLGRRWVLVKADAGAGGR